MKHISTLFTAKKSLLTTVGLAFVLVACNNQPSLPSSSSGTQTSSTSQSSQSSSLDGFATWVNSTQAIDINGDGSINQTDYTLWLEYLVWRDSDAGQDYNDDRKVNTIDFMIYKQFNIWRISDSARDFNDDKLINILDYIIWLDYLDWKDSDEAEDLNNDSKINDLDYEIFLQGSEFEGNYLIRNYNYVGAGLQLLQSGIKFSELGGVLESITLTVDISGEISATIDNTLKSQLGNDLSVVESVFDNMTIERISPLLVAIDTVVIIGGTTINLTFNLTNITGGYRSTTTIVSNSQTITISFDLILL
jgi:hypothetical protein